MPVNETVKTYYQMLARQCGCWSAAHCMRKRGYTLEQCRQVLDDVRHCTRVWVPGGAAASVWDDPYSQRLRACAQRTMARDAIRDRFATLTGA